jgi:hypothetical protein
VETLRRIPALGSLRSLRSKLTNFGSYSAVLLGALRILQRSCTNYRLGVNQILEN